MGLFWYKNKRYSVDEPKETAQVLRQPGTAENVVFPVTDADGMPVEASGVMPINLAVIREGGAAYRMWRDYSAYSAPGRSFCEFYGELLQTAGGCLVSGATGSGKSVVLNGILREILGTFGPEGCRGKSCDIYLCDPKIVEFRRYRMLPQVRKYATGTDEILRVLDEVDAIMMKRYADMAERDLLKWDGDPVFLFIDEIGDLMLTRRADFLPRVTHILQLCRAAGIVVYLASQSPSRKTLPAELILNVTVKIGLRCDTRIESNQVIGMSGCEDLPEHGTALVKMPGRPIRRQDIPNCTESETQAVIRQVEKRSSDCIRKQRIA